MSGNNNNFEFERKKQLLISKECWRSNFTNWIPLLSVAVANKMKKQTMEWDIYGLRYKHIKTKKQLGGLSGNPTNCIGELHPFLAENRAV